MSSEALVQRDSPPGSVLEEFERTTYGTKQKSRMKGFQGDDSESCEEKREHKHKLDKRPSPFRSFSSKLELDAGLQSMFEAPAIWVKVGEDEPMPSNNGDSQQEGFPVLRHLMEPLSPSQREPNDVHAMTKSKRKGRRKRGASLERMIATMILRSSQPPEDDVVPTESGKSTGGEIVSVKEILSDLVKASDAPSSLSGQSKETTPWVNTTRGAVKDRTSDDTVRTDVTKPQSLLSDGGQTDVQKEETTIEENAKVKLEKDDFTFNIGEEWTAFDDCPPFDTSLFPSQELDENGFPVLHEESYRSDPNTKEEIDEEDDLEADEEQMASELVKEMEEEVAKDVTDNRQASGTRASSVVAIPLERIESFGNEAESQLAQKGNLSKEAEMKEENNDFMFQDAAYVKRQIEEERKEQEMVKELARRIAKEQEWGKLQEMAQELARKQLEVERYQNVERQKRGAPKITTKEDHRGPITSEEVEFEDRGNFSDNCVSSPPTKQPRNSQSLAQLLTKENDVPAVTERNANEPCSELSVQGKKKEVPIGSSPRTRSLDMIEEQPPSSPSSVVDLNSSSVANQTNNVSSPTISYHRYRRTRAVFGNRQQIESNNATRPKPTWNPKPPKHYQRPTNGS